MPREQNLEVKVGVFVVIAIMSLVAFIFSVSDFSIFRKGESYRVTFNYANGLKKSAPVRIAGVDAGHIRSIRAFFDRSQSRMVVEVEAWLDNAVAIPADSKFMINQLGLLGEKYLEIMPGTSASFIQPGAVMTGEDPVSMEAVMKQLSGIGTTIESTLGEVNAGVLTDANKDSLTQILANIASVTKKIDQGEGTVGKFLTDPSFYKNLEEFSADVKSHPWKLFYRPKK